jgi:uncharacterized protein YdhG (YjbR/CyaY superfamily)
MPAPVDVAAYLAAQPKQNLPALKQVRALIKKTLPGAKEIISYGIPAYLLPEGTVVFFAGWKEHFSLYPIGDDAPDTLGAALLQYEAGKGTLRFPLDEPVPVKLIEKFVKLRAKEVVAYAAAKKKKKKAR